MKDLSKILYTTPYLIIELFILLDIPSVVTVPPKVVSFTYRPKQLELIDQSIRTNIISLELDQGVYHQVQCPIEFTESGRARLVPCCNSPSAPLNCYTPLLGEQQCLDGNRTRVNGTAIAFNDQRYSFKIENYQTCHSISILANAILGQIFFAVSIRPEFSSASISMNDFLRVEYGSNGLSLCCDQIRELNPSWTGEVYTGWQPFTTTVYEFSIWSDQLLPVTEFYMLPPVDITCDGLHFTPNDCRERGGCLPTPSTKDPLFSNMAATGGLLKSEADPKLFTTGITVRKDRLSNSKISSVRFPFPSERFSDLSCVFAFPTLANNQSELLSDAVGLPFENHIICDPVAFNETLTVFRERIMALGKATPSTYYETNEYLFRALLWVTADPWTSCMDLVERRLLQTVPHEVILVNSNACLESNRSETYLNDPCCNPDLQQTQCCSLRDITAITDGLKIDSNAVTDKCQTPRCATNVLSDYIMLSSSATDRRTGCAVRGIEALTNGLDAVNGLYSCIGSIDVAICISDSVCKNINAASVCLPTGRCSVPCTRNEHCATSVCEVVAGTNNVTSCRFVDLSDFENLSSQVIMTSAWQCVEQNVDPFSILFVKQDLGLNTATSYDDLIQTLVNTGGSPSCIGLNNVPDELCDVVQSCNWAACNSINDPFCNLQSCTDPNLGSDHFCGACQGEFCAELSSFARCEYETSSQQECVDVGGSYNGLSFSTIVVPKCIRPTTTQSECFPPLFCTSTTSCTTKQCYQPNITDEANCTLTTAGASLSWVSWNVSGQTHYLCVSSSLTTYSTCVSDSELRWWPGTVWSPGKLASKEECEFLGLCGGLPTIKAVCDTQFKCSNGSSTNKEDCESASGYCDDFTGCVFPWDPNDFTCPTSHDWTPIGCYSYIVRDNATCAIRGGRWVTRAQSLQECKSKAIICQEPKRAAVLNTIPTPRTQMLPEISLKNEEECLACGGTPSSYYSWSGGQWLANTFIPFQWRQRSFVRSNSKVSLPNYDYFYKLLSASFARRYAKTIESDLWCRFGQFASSLSELTCDCANGGDECFSSVSSSVIGAGLVCSYIGSSFATDAATISTKEDFVVQGDDCMNVRVSIVPMSQFLAKQVSSLSAAAVSSIKSQQRRSVLFLRNNVNIVIGQVIADGVLIGRDPFATNGTFEACITFPTVCQQYTINSPWSSSVCVTNSSMHQEFTAELNVAEYQWAQPNEEFTAFALIGNSVQPGEQTCFSIVNSTQVYFPIGMQKDWQTATFASTLFPGEIFFIVLGMACYILIFVFTAYHFIIHIMLKAPEAQFFNLSTIALLISLIFLINRFIFLAMNLSGLMDLNPQVEVVFSSFPALLFYVIYSIIVIRWAEIHHFTMTAGAKRGISKLRPAIIALNSTLVAAFALLIILFFSLQDHTPVIYSCSTPENRLTDLSVGDIVSIIYKAFFAAVSAVLSALFVIYGVRVLMLMHTATNKSTNSKNNNKQSREQAFRKLMAVSSVCTIALIAQAVFLLWSSATSSTHDEGRFYGILSFLYLTEMPPAVIFVVMFKKASMFIKRDKNSAIMLVTAGSTAPLGTSAASQAEEMHIQGQN